MGKAMQLRPAPGASARLDRNAQTGSVSLQAFDAITKWMALPGMPDEVRQKFIDSWRKQWNLEMETLENNAVTYQR